MFHLKLYCQGLGFLFLTKTQETYWTNIHNLPGPLYENSAVEGN